MKPRVPVCAIVAMWIALAAASPALAGAVPAGSIVETRGMAIDLAAFARTIATRYDVVLQRVVTADIDRDGDLDVVASTDRDFLVWINDGSGRLTSQTPKTDTNLGDAPADRWNGGSARHDETIQNDTHSTRLAVSCTHGPPARRPTVCPASTFACRSALAHDAHVPRAPPVLS